MDSSHHAAEACSVIWDAFSSTPTARKYPFIRRLVQNRIICRVPKLTAGEYTLKIVTRFTRKANLFNDFRTIAGYSHSTCTG
ncbi:MAG: hypothetical protein LBK97_01980 [Prevotellaceae bacterium]|jgi:hypothetical protein|nr:hypothetical protein [Prevotellaceae bacterium]